MSSKPFGEILHLAAQQAHQGGDCFQTWTCPQCGQKQGILEPNAFYTHGKCEECGTIEDMLTNGCGFTLALTAGETIPKEITVYDARDKVKNYN